MLGAILLALFLHWSNENTIVHANPDCPVVMVATAGTVTKSWFPEYEGKIFVPLIGKPYKDNDEAVRECANLNGKPANIYSNEQMQMVMEFIRGNPENEEAFLNHGGAISLRLGMSYDKKERGLVWNNQQSAPKSLRMNNRFKNAWRWRKKSSATLLISENILSQNQFLCGESPKASLVGVLCEIHLPVASTVRAPVRSRFESDYGKRSPIK